MKTALEMFNKYGAHYYLNDEDAVIEAMTQYAQQFIDEIDFDLASMEDTAKGDVGNQITKLRGKIKDLLK